MKKYISVFTIMVMIFLAACSNQNTSSTPTSNENNTQSNSVTKLDEGVWPANEYTEGLPVAPGTHGLHLIQNMRIAISTLPALAKTTITSIWSF